MFFHVLLEATFKKEVLRKLNLLNVKVNSLMESIDTLICSQLHEERSSKNTFDNNLVLDLPITDLTHFSSFEKKMEDKDFYWNFVSFL